MVNNKGWLKIIEASIAILIVVGAIMIISRGTQIERTSKGNEKVMEILDEMAKNISIRKSVLSYNTNMDETYVNNANILNRLNDFVRNKLGNGSNFKIKICDIGTICEINSLTNVETETFERAISAELDSNSFSPKNIKLFLMK